MAGQQRILIISSGCGFWNYDTIPLLAGTLMKPDVYSPFTFSDTIMKKEAYFIPWTGLDSWTELETAFKQ